MSTTSAVVMHIGAQDLIPFPPDDYNPVVIINAYGSENSKTEAVLVIDSDESTRWTSEGADQYVFLELQRLTLINRMLIEWDATIPRTGLFEVDFIQSVATHESEAVVQVLNDTQNGNLFTLIDSEVGYPCTYIKIAVSGNASNNKNGITNVKLWTRTRE